MMYNRTQVPGPPLLPGYQPLRTISQRPYPRPSPVGFIGVLLVIVVLSGGAWYVVKTRTFVPAKNDQREAVTSSPGTLPASIAEDLLRHLDSALTDDLKATEQLKRSQDWVERVVPSLEQQYMGVEKRRLEAAQAASDSAHRDLEQAREELEIIKNLLIERSKP